MYGRPNYSRNYVAYEWVLSKDKLITELKKRIDFLEDDQVKRATEHINLMGENINLRQNLLKAKKTIEVLKEQQSDFDIRIYQERLKKLEAERDHFRLLLQWTEYELKEEKQRQMSESFDFFKNCNSPGELAKRKKALISIFHPDSECGDTKITCMILEQYGQKIENYE